MRKLKMTKLWLSLLLTLGLLSSMATSAQEVYRSEQGGIVSFSDVATAGAERLVLPSNPVADETLARQQAIIDQQLAVASALETSRLAREAARTRRLEAQAQARPQTVYYREQDQTRYIGGFYHNRWDSGSGHKPWHPGGLPRPVHPIGPPSRPGAGHGGASRLDPPSRTVPLPPLKSWTR
jgi:hypothetical protein